MTQQSSGAGGPAFTEKLQSRLTLYDFNGIFQPIKTKRASVKLSGGIGGANVKFYDSGSSTSGLLGTQNFSQYFASSNHFQVHGGVGVQIYPRRALVYPAGGERPLCSQSESVRPRLGRALHGLARIHVRAVTF